MRKTDFKLSVIFSFRNEEAVLPELIRRTRQVVSNLKNQSIIQSHELIFVNDASTDQSLEILLNASQQADDIRIITMSRCFGVSPCVMAGLEYSSGDAIIYMDADLQDPPEVIPELIKAWQAADVDVIHTVRRSRQGESSVKKGITKIGYVILNKITSINLPVEAGDFKLLSRRAVNHLVRLKEKRPFMRGLVCWIGFRQTSISYDRDARFAGETKFKVFSWAVISNFFNSALISFTSVPLVIVSMLGFIAILVDFGVMAHAFHEKSLGRAVPGWTAIMISTLFMGGVQLLCLGIIGLYIHSIFEEAKGRPNYIIESTMGFKKSNDQSSN